ncbi:SdrD B-like domain-containing protein [Aridibaculum aurantiacum]|uniref:SdrD B-like domain-containing protein n=1 Tax=Aridibaculum aurantiacum TaxID=2810307 RepID=UPI001A9668DF|nr:SdrD B-like domain-containing protein [Aridibaculum aurantiacum]
MKQMVAFAWALLLFTTLVSAQEHGLHFKGRGDNTPNDFVTTNTAEAFKGYSNNFTMELWVFPKAERTITTTTEASSGSGYEWGQQYAIFPAQYEGDHAGAGLSIGTNGVTVYEHCGGGYFPAVLIYNAPILGWHHIAVVYENRVPKLYIDGVYKHTGIAGSKSNVHPSATFSDPLYYKGAYVGYIDEARIWSSARTEAEISTYRNTNVAASELGLISYFQFNQGSAYGNNNSVNTLINAVDPAFNGTLHNFKLETIYSNWTLGYNAPIPANHSVKNQRTNKEFYNIQDAIDLAEPGDKLLISAGTFVENLNVWKTIELHGNNYLIPASGLRNAETIIDGSSSAEKRCITINTNDTKVSVLGIKFINGHPLHDGNEKWESAEFIFQNNVVENALSIFGKFIWKKIYIDNNSFTNITGPAIQIAGGNDITITRNTITTANAGMLINGSANRIEQVLLSQNKVFKTNEDGIQLAGMINNAAVTLNEITEANISPGEYGGIHLFELDALGKVVIEFNKVVNSHVGINLKSNSDISNMDICARYNDLGLTNDFPICNAGEGTLCATCNWFGTTPKHYSGTKEEMPSYAKKGYIVGKANFTPWLIDGTDGSTETGFQANQSACVGVPFSFTATGTDIKCAGQADGTITIVASGGTAPYHYTISGFVSGPIIGSFSGTEITIPGFGPWSNYKVELVDANDLIALPQHVCIKQTVTPLDASTSLLTPADCITGVGGSFKLTITGGTAPYKVNGVGIDGNEMTFSNLTVKQHTYVVSDKFGCTDIVHLQINKNCEEQCFESPTKAAIVNAKSIWFEDPINSNYIIVRATLANTFVDNSYGTNAIGWPGNNHTFNHLVQSDQLQFALFDKAGVRKLEFKMDYISKSGSKYISLGATGGDGAMIFPTRLANADDLKDFNSSLAVNLGQSFGSQYLVNSPGLTDPNRSDWIYDVWYEFKVKKSVFGTVGFGYPMITGLHASPSKTGQDSEVIVPSDCPGELTIGDKVWNDADGDGILNNENGIGGLTVKLYRDNNVVATTTTAADGSYAFNNRQPGFYVVGVTLPANHFASTTHFTDVNNGVDNDNNGLQFSPTEVRTGTINLTQNNHTIDIGLKVEIPACTNPDIAAETFPNSVNINLEKGKNYTLTGSSGVSSKTWTLSANSFGIVASNNSHGGSTNALILEVLKTDNKSTASATALSPANNISGTCCPAKTIMNFKIWKRTATSGDVKSNLKLEFSGNDGSSWTQVASVSPADVVNASGKEYSITIPTGLQTNKFKYRFTMSMQKGGTTTFGVSIDDITITSPNSCETSRSTSEAFTISEDAITTVAQAAEEQSSQVTQGDQKLAVKVLNNPTRTAFQLQVLTIAPGAASLRVIDMAGRKIQELNVVPNKIISIGNAYKKGTYFVEVVQGEERKVLKLIKL